jgi:glycosyltransferase involved in cell wall biosynthesis
MPKIAVYTIALNEERYVDTWFHSVKEADYWLVADTGSSDQTVHKLRELGAKCEVIHVRPWRFDMARNIALSLIPEHIDICISMDMDEHMAPGWRPILEAAWQSGATRVNYDYHTYYNAASEPHLKFMANKIHARHNYTWRRPVHESVFVHGTETLSQAPGLLMKHVPDPTKSRGQYLHLLEISHQENVTCAQTLFWLAREHAYQNNSEQAIAYFHKLLALEHVWHLEKSEAERWLAKLLPHEQLQWLRRCVATAPERREGWRDLAQHLYAHSKWISCYAACSEALSITQGTNSYLDTADVWGPHLHDLAAISAWNMGLKSESEAHAQAAVNLAPDDQRLQNNLTAIQHSLGKTS